MASPGTSVEVDHIPGSYEARLVLDTLLPENVTVNTKTLPLRKTNTIPHDRQQVLDPLDTDGDITMDTAGTRSRGRSEVMDNSFRVGSAHPPDFEAVGKHDHMNGDGNGSSSEDMGMCRQLPIDGCDSLIVVTSF